MMRLDFDHIIISLLVTISIVLGCGVMPPGQASTRTFNVTGFTTLPIAMVYSRVADVRTRISGIGISEAGARGFVERIVMQTLFDVLERQARSALLPDAIITAILSQLTVQISYKPMDCLMVVKPEDKPAKDKERNCIIVSDTVTGICYAPKQRRAKKCTEANGKETSVEAIPIEHLSISGILSTTNFIMESWSKAMWQRVVHRALRMLASSPYGTHHFFSAKATVGGN
ncbi:hypothetical protein KIN20_030267 [Parelaphostrongylus tenuis]|uniref:Uncharacterized protein n=1 Tax=Parelaphostrongylus tenuis TaxID=148309 RepID=A0AAD5R4J2_PARTN|nr:hypothetical protein KIN20_030267 [Parelaphostrongylus tenuis]